MIEQFIEQAAGKYGIDAGTARSLTGSVVSMLRKDGDDADFEAVAEQVPGLDAVADEAEAGEAEAAPASGGFGGALGLGGLGGGLGGLAGMAAKAVGGGGAMDLIQKFTGAGLSMDSAGDFVQMLVKFLKDKAGEGVINQITAKVPMLAKFLG